MADARFDSYFRQWVSDACSKWGEGYPEPPPEYFSKIYTELGQDLQSSVVAAIDEGLVIPKGKEFLVKDGRRGLQGPYSWFSRNREPRPNPNLEYFVQVGEFLRLDRIAKRHGMKAFFEFEAMDVSLYGDGNRIVVISETKVDKAKVRELIEGMKRFEKGIDYSEEDLRFDPLRKAKYIQTWRPDYFCAVAVGERRTFRVTYEGRPFHLVEAPLPWD